MKIAKYFKPKEFMVSRHYPHLAKDIFLTENDLYKLFLICKLVLDPLREEYGKIIITSGKRTEQLNKLVGGASGSQHLFRGFDAAVDFCLEENDNLQKAFYYIIKNVPQSYCDLILYYTDDLAPNFIHFGFINPDRKNNNIRYYFNGKYYKQDPQAIIVT